MRLFDQTKPNSDYFLGQMKWVGPNYLPETSQKIFEPQGGQARGRVNRGSRGASFPKICILGIFGDISSNLIQDRKQKPPKKILTPRGARRQVNRGPGAE